MKFTSSKFWRQRGDCCLFMEILHVVSDDENMITLTVSWYRQLNDMYRFLGTENIRIRSKEYDNWTAYNPRGEVITYAS